MDTDRFHFERGAIRPMQCLSEGWQLVKSEYWFFLGVTVVGSLVAGLAPFAILYGPAMCGIHICLLRQANGQRVSFDMLFQGFNYFGQSLLATMAMLLPELVIAVILYAFYLVGVFFLVLRPQAGGPPGDAELIAYFGLSGALIAVALVVALFFKVLFFFTYPLIVDREMTGMEAVFASFRAARANLGGVLSVVLLEFMFETIGFMLCLVGMYFLLPLTFGMTMIAYRQVFPMMDPFAEMARDMAEDTDLPPAPIVVSEDTGIQSREPRPTGVQERPPQEPGPATS